MASSTDNPIGLKNRVVILMLIIYLTIFYPKSACSALSSGNMGEKQVKMVLGSVPPSCVNKCLNCRPCGAILVIHTHRKRRRFKASSSSPSPSSSTSQGDGNYYLLSWRCKCGNKLFHP